MSNIHKRPLCQLLTGDTNPAQLNLWQWQPLIEQGRNAKVLGILYARLQQRMQLDDVPDTVVQHLLSDYRFAEKLRRDLLCEIRRLASFTSSLQKPIILVGSAAGLLAKKPCYIGRQITAIDVLVDLTQVTKLMSLLEQSDWYSVCAPERAPHKPFKTSMRHKRLDFTINIYHRILPEGAKLTPAIAPIVKAAGPIPSMDRKHYGGQLWYLSATDQLLYCANHLFMSTQLTGAFVELIDFDGLLRDWLTQEDNWDDLLKRAEALDLSTPLFYSLRYSRRVFNTPIPGWVEDMCRPQKFTRWRMKTMDRLFFQVLTPPQNSSSQRRKALAQSLLELRGHYLRTPFSPFLGHAIKHWLPKTIKSIAGK